MHSIKRFLQICFYFIPPFIAFSFSKSNPQSEKLQSSVKKIRAACQNLGVTFIKLGQLLSARPDLVGPELATELRNLLDTDPPIPFSKIKLSVESGLNEEIGKIFKTFEEKPLCTASIAQVHRGLLPNGKKVAIKVQREGLLKIITEDLAIFKTVAGILDLLVKSKGLQVKYIYEEFKEWITNELDFAVEARRAEKFAENMEGVDGIVIPRPLKEYSTGKVLVMELTEGITLNEALNEMKKQGVSSLYDVKLDFKIDASQVMERLVNALVKQLFVDRFFHGDLHPANIILMKESRVAFVDFGIVGTLDNEEQTKLLFMLLTLLDNDPHGLIKVILSATVGTMPDEQIKILYQEFSRELHKLHEESLGKASLSHFIMLLMSLTHRYNVLWSSGLVLAAKTISQVDSIGSSIGYEKSVVDLLKPEVEKHIAQTVSSGFSKEMVYKSLLELIEAGKKLPDTLSELERAVHTLNLQKI